MTSINIEADTRTVPELFRELASETAILVKKEVELARVELARKAEEAKLTAFEACAGLALFFSGVLVVLLGITWGLAQSMPLWIAALIVGIIAAVAGALMLKAVENAPSALFPKQTVMAAKDSARDVSKSVRENAHELKKELS